MIYFDSDFVDFFKELAPNNNKDWFDVNRKRYTDIIKEPFKAFVAKLIEELSQRNPKLKDLEPKDCIFRINRDIRFAKDKTPYKMNVSALVAAGGKKNDAGEGCYVEFGPEHVRIYGGLYEPDKVSLLKIRQGIAADPKPFQKLYSEKEFKKLFCEIRGDKNKIIPKEVKAAAEVEPLIFNKQFYYFHQMDPTVLTEEGLMDQILHCYDVARPVEQYFSKILNK
jgi:uncharacterized protein (TIGR02453 family)